MKIRKSSTVYLVSKRLMSSSDLHMDELEAETGSPDENRFLQFNRICWPIVDQYRRNLFKKPLRQYRGNPLMRQMEALADWLTTQAQTLKGRRHGWVRILRNLPRGYLKRKKFEVVAEKLNQGCRSVEDRKAAIFSRKSVSKRPTPASRLIMPAPLHLLRAPHIPRPLLHGSIK